MKTFSLITVCAMLASCTPAAPSNSGVYMLIDTSGTYREEMLKAEQIIRYSLSRLDAADSFAVGRYSNVVSCDVSVSPGPAGGNFLSR